MPKGFVENLAKGFGFGIGSHLEGYVNCKNSHWNFLFALCKYHKMLANDDAKTIIFNKV